MIILLNVELLNKINIFTNILFYFYYNKINFQNYIVLLIYIKSNKNIQKSNFGKY